MSLESIMGKFSSGVSLNYIRICCILFAYWLWIAGLRPKCEYIVFFGMMTFISCETSNRMQAKNLVRTFILVFWSRYKRVMDSATNASIVLCGMFSFLSRISHSTEIVT